MRLGPRQQHTLTIALSSADCAARRQEKGILQQLVLLVFAAAPATSTTRALGGIAAAVADCPADWSVPEAAAPATAAAAGAARPPPFTLFVVARRVTVALVDRPADLASLMSAEAKPYISGAGRQGHALLAFA